MAANLECGAKYIGRKYGQDPETTVATLSRYGDNITGLYES
jgi:hypothetical protein